MSLITCPECGGEWFRHETLFQFADDVFDDDGEPEIVEYRYLFRCIPCDSLLDLSLYRQEIQAK